jgi:hypothetical protein
VRNVTEAVYKLGNINAPQPSGRDIRVLTPLIQGPEEQRQQPPRP